MQSAGAAVVIEPGLSFGVELDAAAAAARASVRDATRADGAVAASLADALEALGDAPSLEEIATAARKAFSNKPLECVGCIVAGAFSDLFVVNFGLADAACEVCSCASLTEAACTQAIQVALYAGIALMPVIAVSIFEECEGLCESDASEVDPPSLAIPRCPARASFGDFLVSNDPGRVPARQKTEGWICHSDDGFTVAEAATDAHVFSDGNATACDSAVFVKSDALEVFIAPVRVATDDPTWYYELDAAPDGTMWAGLSNNSKGTTAYCVDEHDCAAGAGPLPCRGTSTFAHNMTVAAATSDDGWTTRLSIPWAIFADEFRPRAGAAWPHWRLNFYRYDYPDGEAGPAELSAWSPTHDPSFHVPREFGSALLLQ